MERVEEKLFSLATCRKIHAWYSSKWSNLVIALIGLLALGIFAYNVYTVAASPHEPIKTDLFRERGTIYTDNVLEHIVL